jgi:hypothetical protein
VTAVDIAKHVVTLAEQRMHVDTLLTPDAIRREAPERVIGWQRQRRDLTKKLYAHLNELRKALEHEP